MRRADIGIRIRADAKFARLVDEAARLSGDTRSGFIRYATLQLAREVIQKNWAFAVVGDAIAEDAECTPTQSR